MKRIKKQETPNQFALAKPESWVLFKDFPLHAQKLANESAYFLSNGIYLDAMGLLCKREWLQKIEDADAGLLLELNKYVRDFDRNLLYVQGTA